MSAPRPRQVTLAAVMSIVGSLLLLVGVVDTLGRLRTPEMREEVGDLLSRPAIGDLGLDVAQVIDGMRILAYVSAALAAAAFVLAIYVLRKDRGARVGLTVAAVLLLATVPVAGLMPFFLAAAAGFLWSQPARDWFAGRTPAPATPRPFGGTPPPHPPSDVVPPSAPPSDVVPPSAPPSGVGRPESPAPGPGGDPAAAAPPVVGPPPGQGRIFLEDSPGFAPAPPPAAVPPAPGTWPGTTATDPGPRPASVTVAVLLALLGSLATITVMALFMGILALDADAFVDEFEQAASGTPVELDRSQILAVGWGTAAIFSLWALTATVLAGLAFRRSQAGRIGLVISSALTALVSLVMVLSVVTLVPLVLAATTTVLLLRRPASDWFEGRAPQRPPHSPPPSYPPPPSYRPPNEPW